MQKYNVLIVDDSPEDIRILKEGLQQYTIQVATNGIKAIEMISSFPPDIILMDVEMPQMNGYETSQKIKQNTSTQQIPIIFISSHDSIEEIMKGYESGGSDYMIKPAQTETVIQKIELALATASTIKNLSHQKDDFNKMGMSYISNMGELGVVIEFLEKISTVDMIDDVGYTLLKSIKHFQITGTVQIRYLGGKFNISQNGEEVSAIESKLLSRYNPKNPIYISKSRLVVSYQWVTLFLKDMPEDKEKSERYRDHLEKMVATASNKVKYLLGRQEHNKYIGRIYDILKEIDKQQIEYKHKATTILEDILIKLESNFTPWGLSDDQEQLLLQIVEDGVEKTNSHMKQGQIESKKQHEELSLILAVIQNMS